MRFANMLRKTLIRYLQKAAGLNDSPERVALAFAFGVFLAFSPLLGLHTILALALAFVFGLNRVAVLVGSFINNPWTLVPIYAAATYLGGTLIGFPERETLPSFGIRQLSDPKFWTQLAGQWTIIKPLMLGSTILSIICAIVSYLVVLYFLRRTAKSGRTSNF